MKIEWNNFTSCKIWRSQNAATDEAVLDNITHALNARQSGSVALKVLSGNTSTDHGDGIATCNIVLGVVFVHRPR